MKRWVMAGMLALAVAGLVGCDEDEETTGGGISSSNLNGTWNGTMVATRLMGYPAEDSDVVPISLVLTMTEDNEDQQYYDIVFRANGMPGIFTGRLEKETMHIVFSATADYTYTFIGTAGASSRTMSGTWSVNIPGGMSGTWQASQ